MLGTGLGQTEEGIATVAPDVAAGSGADLAAGDLAANIVFGAVGMQRDLRAIQHPQQFGLVGMQPCQQAIERGKAGAAAEDAIEPRAQSETAALAGMEAIDLEVGIEVPDQLAHALLRRSMQIRERLELVHQ